MNTLRIASRSTHPVSLKNLGGFSGSTFPLLSAFTPCARVSNTFFKAVYLGLHRVYCTSSSGETNDDKVKHYIDFGEQLITEFMGKLHNKVKELPSVKSKSCKYKDAIFKLLDDYRGTENPNTLRQLQFQIETLTMQFDEESIFDHLPNIIRILISSDLPTAKEIMRDRISKDLIRNKLSRKPGEKGLPYLEDVLELLSYLGHYTLEAICLHVICVIFNRYQPKHVVKVGKLIEKLDTVVRTHASLCKERKASKAAPAVPTEAGDSSGSEEAPAGNATEASPKKYRFKVHKFALGVVLVEFLLERGIIVLPEDSSNYEEIRAKPKKGQWYLPLTVNVFCNFDLSELPIKMNLPMIVKPSDWMLNSKVDPKDATLSDIQGGYLSNPTGEIYHNLSVLTSHNKDNFNIKLEMEWREMFRAINVIQSQPFTINKQVFHFIHQHRASLEFNKFLAPGFLANCNQVEVLSIVQKTYYDDPNIKTVISLSALKQRILKDIQQANIESFILELAEAYMDYQFYLPAFLDFRGRIYRAGVLTFHERDLARALICFPESRKQLPNENDLNALKIAAGFHFKSFSSYGEALTWYTNSKASVGVVRDIHPYLGIMPLSDEQFIGAGETALWDSSLDTYKLMVTAKDAKHPFQFVANILAIQLPYTSYILRIPITQDASSSAYQIMSYMLFNVEIAKHTNLIPEPDNYKIYDFYIHLQGKLKDYFRNECDPTLFKVVEPEINRKLIKSIFMPMIYGKTTRTIGQDLMNKLSHYISPKDCYKIAVLSDKFWKDQYPGIDNLMKLIAIIAWFTSSLNSFVTYGVPMYSTIQDYTVNEKISIYVHDRATDKRRKVTLNVPTNKRDNRKAKVSSFANFIHQKDAYIAMKVVLEMYSKHHANIYTVHDNFITNAKDYLKVTKAYGKAFHSLPTPLELVNTYIHNNLIADSNGSLKRHLLLRENEELYLCPGCSEGCYQCTLYSNFNPRVPIPRGIMNQFMFSLVEASSYSKVKYKTWEKNIALFKTYYYEFVKEVCSLPSNGDSTTATAPADSTTPGDPIPEASPTTTPGDSTVTSPGVSPTQMDAHELNYCNFVGLMTKETVGQNYSLHH